ncbi:Malonyl-[acyl-carrier protein] O-methyltransferase [Aquicella lusitana]|uniref:Malonyl-CoA O-methyltransferase n=1 Tax=Aquicella lusitana TaxID=254246 RepID=A0A370GF13_9COXI|nr:malonyl-CoA O-methyltransferase [Aquicella lusitana]VVC72675.1 Malonyl-[acyl-carrier protein] O-methyltransferase [Aquicella lusitana]
MLSREVGEEILSRLAWMTLKPEVIVDAGCGTGEMSARLQACYPDARVIALDISEPMITYAKQQMQSASGKISCLQADAGCLPFADQSVDFLFAHLLLPWHEDHSRLFREWRRVLRPDGLLFFTVLGPDTLREWEKHTVLIPSKMDMHDMGDLLLKEGFADPVLDVDYFTVRYKDKDKMMRELCASGMLMLEAKRDITDEYAWQVTYEVVYGHSFAPLATGYAAQPDGTARVPLASLKKKLIAKD